MPRIDSNIIIRFLTNEPAEQAQRVASLFERIETGELEVTIDETVVAEGVWTLSSYYRMPKGDVVEAMLQIVSQDGIECRGGEAVRRALVLFETKNIDFIDALLCARMLEDDEPEIYSLDRDFDRVEGIRRLEPA